MLGRCFPTPSSFLGGYKLTMMRDKAIISNLHLKFAEKTWSETFQLVRRCMEKSRDASKPCEPLVRSLERLQKALHAPSMNTTKSRLETIAKQQGMGFHATEATCYLTGNLFYVEVVLLPHGEVQEVKVAPHGKPPSPSESLLHLLRSHNFADFSLRLGGLFAQYNIPGDGEIKLKLLTSLQYLEKDLQQISNLHREPKHCDPQIDLINYGRVGFLIAGKEAVVQAAQVTVGVSGVTHRLQMASVLPQLPELDPRRCLAFTPLSEGPHETLPACFLLRLQPPVPVMSSFVEKLKQITDVAVPEFNLQWAPLPKLLLKASRSSDPCGDTRSDQELLAVPLPGGVTHSYVLPGTAWDAPTQRATVVDGVPFTQPAHVPALLELLRHQCAINTLLRSCVCAPSTNPGLICEWHFEVIPESATSFSVTFHQPHTDSLAVLLVNVSNPHQITCKLFGSGICDSSLDEHVSTVMRSCMSIPVTMKALYSRMEEMISGPVSPSRLATTGAENPHFTPKMDTNKESPTVSQSAAVPEGGAGVSSSACDAKSELPSGINTSSPVNS
ncbi:mediator of RNA polymerase II transcription subunit 1 isoform X7 [Kryptolebias marmoratus]|uniref:mediator of RNA polymerase II transcription subunit 1 isoform X7 n=1 Tax=Kryptolebias marmoratus TaxID=37003 RepID=UPI000D52F442|nr:mediator of RNA polymerase II transcription subunit 1 isoform X7 [Kryptolebias marmoratus]